MHLGDVQVQTPGAADLKYMCKVAPYWGKKVKAEGQASNEPCSGRKHVIQGTM